MIKTMQITDGSLRIKPGTTISFGDDDNTYIVQGGVSIGNTTAIDLVTIEEWERKYKVDKLDHDSIDKDDTVDQIVFAARGKAMDETAYDGVLRVLVEQSKRISALEASVKINGQRGEQNV